MHNYTPILSTIISGLRRIFRPDAFSTLYGDMTGIAGSRSNIKTTSGVVSFFLGSQEIFSCYRPTSYVVSNNTPTDPTNVYSGPWNEFETSTSVVCSSGYMLNSITYSFSAPTSGAMAQVNIRWNGTTEIRTNVDGETGDSATAISEVIIEIYNGSTWATIASISSGGTTGGWLTSFQTPYMNMAQAKVRISYHGSKQTVGNAMAQAVANVSISDIYIYG